MTTMTTTTPSQKKRLIIFGATGQQGGSVATTLLTSPSTSAQYEIVAITRSPTKPAALALSALGATVTSADLSDKASLVSALTGAYGVFAVTNYWESGSAAVEIAQGRNVADACKETGVQHLVWMTNGVLSNVSHFDSKAAVESYIRALGIPATFFLPGFYMSNIPGGIMQPAPETGVYMLTLPISGRAEFPLLDAGADTGKFVKNVFLQGVEKWGGKRVFGASEYVRGDDIVAQFKDAKKRTQAEYVQVPHEVFKGFLGVAGAEESREEMLQNLRLVEEFGYYGGEALEESVKLAESDSDKLTSWREFVDKAEAWKDL